MAWFMLGKGFTIFYDESLIVNKPMSILGENSQDTIIRDHITRRYSNPTIFQINANNVTISGFTMDGSSSDILGVTGNSSCKIISNNILNCLQGVSFEGTNNIVSGNHITGNSLFGIVSSSNAIISDNYISKSLFAGIDVNSQNVTVTRNNIVDNGNPIYDFTAGLLLGGDQIYVYENNITGNFRGIEYNNVCSHSIVCYNNIDGNGIGVNAGNLFSNVSSNSLGSENKVYCNNIVNTKNAFVEFAYPEQINFTSLYDYKGNGTDSVSWDNGKEGNTGVTTNPNIQMLHKSADQT